jgi:hypothetical protein
MPNVWLMARPLLPELIKAIRVTSRGVSPYFLARKQTRQPGGHADSRVVVNGEGSNLSPSRTDPPSHASEAVASATTLANMWTDFDLNISGPISVDDPFPRRVGSEMFGFDRIRPSIHRRRIVAGQLILGQDTETAHTGSNPRTLSCSSPGRSEAHPRGTAATDDVSTPRCWSNRAPVRPPLIRPGTIKDPERNATLTIFVQLATRDSDCCRTTANASMRRRSHPGCRAAK